MTADVPVPLRAASTQTSSPAPLREIACVDGSLVVSVLVDAAETSAGASGLEALSSEISGFSTLDQNVQFQPSRTVAVVPAARDVAAVEREAARAVDDRVVRHVALLRERRQHESGAVGVVAAARADLQRRPDRVTRRDRGDCARPGADVVQVRRRVLQRDGVDVDAVHVGDGAVAAGATPRCRAAPRSSPSGGWCRAAARLRTSPGHRGRSSGSRRTAARRAGCPPSAARRRPSRRRRRLRRSRPGSASRSRARAAHRRTIPLSPGRRCSG